VFEVLLSIPYICLFCRVKKIEAVWVRRFTRLGLIISALLTAFLLQRFARVYWDGWIILTVFMILDDFFGELLEDLLAKLFEFLRSKRSNKSETPIPQPTGE